ncbi:MAG: AI-2E family transporter [Bacteroidia bacterium]|nr:AI-2E family transporter [Bacteroidia bacterium]
MSIDKELQLPFYAKASIFLIGLVAFVAILYIAQSIIVPIVFAVVIAIVLHPVVNFFVRIKINRIIAIVFTLLLMSFVLFAFFALLFSQASQFSDSWPQLVDKFTDTLNQSISSLSGYLDINPQKIHTWITKTKDEFLNVSNEAIGQTLLSVGGVIMVLFLIPVYVFLLLFYQPIIIEFIHRLFQEEHQSKVKEIVSQTKTVIQHYLIGLIIEAVIVAILNTVVLLTLGIEYALLLGIIGAVLNVIPYIGGLVAVALPMLVALATKSTAWYPVYVLMGYYIIQLIDNNYIVPYIVASKVKINALFSIIVVFVGNALWGVPGMFLSIPLLAIVKLIFDHIDSLKPWGFLLGDTMPPLLKIKPILKIFEKKELKV